MPTAVELIINLRSYQRPLFEDDHRFRVRLLHRRAGKSWLALVELLVAALQPKRKALRLAYIGPTYTQTKAIAWGYLREFAAGIPGVVFNETELRCIFPTGAEIRLFGAENYDRLRGLYLDGCVIDEAAYVPSEALTLVLLPALADRQGWLTVMGTPAGRMNLLAECWELAGDDPEWSRVMLTFEQTGAIKPEEIERLRRFMSEAEFEQELNCSFDAAMRGSYYGKELTKADAEGRITDVRYDRTLPVQVGLDLGYGDLMVSVYVQHAGTEHRILGAEGFEATSIPELVEHWRTLPFPIERVVLPHDAKVHELGSGDTRQHTFEKMGCSTILAPRLGLVEGIEQTRMLLDHCWFDREGTKALREALAAYRSEYDEVRRVHSMKPVHDWASHWADAFRHYATGRRDIRPSKPLGRPVWAA